jgi:golgin subfamily A protein 1
MTQNWQDEKTHNLSLKDKIAQLSEEKDHFVVRNAELSQQVSLSQQQLQRTEKELRELQDKFSDTERENQQIKLLLSDAEARDENSERTCKLRSQIAELEAAFSEKNKTIKLQQQRLSDMKKTLQKELKNQNNDPDNLSVPTSASSSTAPKSPVLPKAPQPAKNEMDEVNFKYLKHVIFKFLTSREYEVTIALSSLIKSIF